MKKLNKVKAFSIAAATSSGLIMAVPVLADTGTADVAVTGAFTTVANNVIATLGAVAPIAIGIFALFLGFRYGKKIFTQLSK